jgi:hypothetical protein
VSAPLRRVVRTWQRGPFEWFDELDCGHMFMRRGAKDSAARRRCVQCAAHQPTEVYE